MKFYTVTAVLQETVETTVHTDFAAAVSRINKLLDSDFRFRECLQAYVIKVFGVDIPVETAVPYIQLLCEYGTPSADGFMFRDYSCGDREVNDFWIMVSCTVHELQFTSPLVN